VPPTTPGWHPTTSTQTDASSLGSMRHAVIDGSHVTVEDAPAGARKLILSGEVPLFLGWSTAPRPVVRRQPRHEGHPTRCPTRGIRHASGWPLRWADGQADCCRARW
jgi:hypothetical protein